MTVSVDEAELKEGERVTLLHTHRKLEKGESPIQVSV